MKMTEHLKIPVIQSLKLLCTSKSNFNFSFVEKVDTLKEIITSQSNKATKNTDITTKLIEDNEDILAGFIFISLNKRFEQTLSPSKLKLVDLKSVYKKI